MINFFVYLEKGFRIFNFDESTSFKIRDVIIDITTLSAPSFCWKDILQSQISKRGRVRKNMSTCGVLKSPCHSYLPGGA